MRSLFRRRLVGACAALAVVCTGCGREAADGTYRTIAGTRTRLVVSTPVAARRAGLRVLLLHGASYTADVWQRTGISRRLVAAGYDVTAVDLPGFGSSDGLSAGTDRSEYLRALIDRVDADPTEPLVVVAPSMSGSYLLPALADGAGPTGAVFVAPVGGGSFDPRRTLRTEHALAIRGAADHGFSRLDNQHLAAEFADGRAVTIPNAGHAAYEDRPVEFTRHLLAFLRPLAPRR